MSDAAFVPPFTRPQLVLELPPDGLTVNVVASVADCRALADFMDLPSIDRLTAEYLVRSWGKSGLIVTGKVVADVIQTCVVSLEPVPEHIEEPVEVKFMLPADLERYIRKQEEAGEIDLDGEAVDQPDEFDGQSIDLGLLTMEFLALGLDPYPRKPGVVFDPAAFGVGPAPDEKVSPFAALAKLKPADE